MAFYLENNESFDDTFITNYELVDKWVSANTILSGGGNGQGTLGINSTTSSNYSTFQTIPSITNIKQIAAGALHVLGLKTDGTIIVTGWNAYGQLGLNSTNNYSSFQTVPSITNIKQIACGSGHSLGLKTDGTLISCGNNTNGQLGINSTTISRYSSFQTVPSITNIKQVSCGYHHSFCLKTDNTLIACGRNSNGQLGIFSTTDNSIFQSVPSITNIKQIVAGTAFSLGLKTDGTLISCGYNNRGQMGLNNGNNYSSFQTIPSIANIKQISAGSLHALCLKTDGTLIAAGYNLQGQLGINSTATSNYSSFQTVPSITNIKQIACGGNHSVGLKIDGTLISCGMNDMGQLGINSTIASNYSSFQLVPLITNIKQISLGSNYSGMVQY